MRLVTRAERLSSLLEMLVEHGRIDVEHSADHFGVSAATIRRDLDYLADQQLLSRTHGGAVPNTTSYDLPLRYKSISRGEAKARIAERAVAMMWPGCTLSLNGGTTTVEVARAISGSPALHNGVTVVTNAINIATETLSQLTPDLCFLGAIGVDPAAGITTYDEDEAAINRVMVTQAKRTVVVCDASKLGHVGFSRICHVHEVSAIITDAAADPAMVATLESQGVEVILA